jgi:hypothetical protein
MRLTFSAIFIFAAFYTIAGMDSLPDSTSSKTFNTIKYDTANTTESFRERKPTFMKRSEWIVPAALITSGAVIALNKWDEFFLSNLEIQEERNHYFPKFANGADNYLQMAPAFAVLAFRSCGIKGRNNFGNQLAILIKTEILITAIVTPLKTIAAEPRPDSGARNSFPSGHTTQAFAAATIFAKEYGYRSPWYSIGAYTVATGVGAMRILNNRHWFSDVLAGAGIGVLSANLVYATHRHKWGTHTNLRTGLKKNNQLIVTPTYGGYGSTGLYLSYKF